MSEQSPAMLAASHGAGWPPPARGRERTRVERHLARAERAERHLAAGRAARLRRASDFVTRAGAASSAAP